MKRPILRIAVAAFLLFGIGTALVLLSEWELQVLGCDTASKLC